MLRIMEILGNLISDHDFYHVQYRIMNIKETYKYIRKTI